MTLGRSNGRAAAGTEHARVAQWLGAASLVLFPSACGDSKRAEPRSSEAAVTIVEPIPRDDWPSDDVPAEAEPHRKLVEGEVLSPSGYFAMTVVPRDGCHAVRIRRTSDGKILLVDPNPGGCTSPSFSASFTAGDNIFASWGCGTYCSVTVLMSAQGEVLRHLDFAELSPSKRHAVSYPAAPHRVDGPVRVIDVRTGAIVREELHQAVSDICAVEWETSAVVLDPCNPTDSAIRLSGLELHPR